MELNGDFMWTPPTLESRRGGLLLIDATAGITEGALKLITRQLRVLVTIWANETPEGEARISAALRCAAFLLCCDSIGQSLLFLLRCWRRCFCGAPSMRSSVCCCIQPATEHTEAITRAHHPTADPPAYPPAYPSTHPNPQEPPRFQVWLIYTPDSYQLVSAIAEPATSRPNTAREIAGAEALNAPCGRAPPEWKVFSENLRGEEASEKSAEDVEKWLLVRADTDIRGYIC